jgi:hypothetical protein
MPPLPFSPVSSRFTHGKREVPSSRLVKREVPSSNVGGDNTLHTHHAGPEPLVLDLRIAHDRFGSSSDPSLNGHLHYPNDLDGPLNEAVIDKIRQYRADYNNRPSNAISFMPAITSVVTL